MYTSGKILKYPYEKESVLSVLEECFAFIESYCIINSIPSPKIILPYQIKVFYLFANNPPSSWLELISDLLETQYEDDFARTWGQLYLKDTLNLIKEEVMSNEQ